MLFPQSNGKWKCVNFRPIYFNIIFENYVLFHFRINLHISDERNHTHSINYAPKDESEWRGLTTVAIKLLTQPFGGRFVECLMKHQIVVQF